MDAGTCGVLCKATFDLEETDVDGADDDVTPPRNLSHLSHTLQWFRTQVRVERRAASAGRRLPKRT